MKWKSFMVVGWMVLLFGTSAQADEKSERLIKALADPSLKIRLQAAILVGKHGIQAAVPALKSLLDDADPEVRVAAAVSLGRLGDQTSRSNIVKLLGNGSPLETKAAEMALGLLDQALGRPKFFVVLEQPLVPNSTSSSLSKRILRVLRNHLSKNSILVLSEGEEQFLSGPQLVSHFKQRKLTAMLLKPKLVNLQRRVHGRSTSFEIKLSVMTVTFLKNRMEYTASGVAEADVESNRVSEEQAREIEGMLLDEAAKVASNQTIKFLERRKGP